MKWIFFCFFLRLSASTYYNWNVFSGFLVHLNNQYSSGGELSELMSCVYSVFVYTLVLAYKTQILVKHVYKVPDYKMSAIFDNRPTDGETGRVGGRNEVKHRLDV